MLRLFLAILLIMFAGWNVLGLVSFKKRILCIWEGLAVSFGLGVGFISMTMLLLHFISAKLTMLNIAAPWLVLFAINLFLGRINKNKNTFTENSKNSGTRRPLVIFLACATLFEIIYAFFRALIKPIESYDAIAIYAIKAKMVYLAGAMPVNFFNDLIKAFPHPDYPLNIPLCESFIYLFLGNMNDQLVKIIFPLYFVSILAILYFAVTRIASKSYALLFTFILASVPQFNSYAANGYLDLPLAYYCFASALFLYYWMEDTARTQCLLISACMAGLAGWTKNEGLMYCGINALVLAVFFTFDPKGAKSKKRPYFFAYIAIMFLISLPWIWIKHAYHITNSEIDIANLNPVNLVKQFYKIGPIAYEFQKQFFGPKKWNILWPAAFIILFFNYRIAFTELRKYIVLSLSLTVLGYILIYMISYVDINYFLGKTWARFLMHFLPFVIYWLAISLKEEVKI